MDVIRRRCTGAAALAAFLAVGAAAWAQISEPAPWAHGGSKPANLVFTLVTEGRATPIYTWWGHTGIIVEDTKLKQSRMYNYGLFSFDKSGFVRDTIMGRLWFGIGGFPTAEDLQFEKGIGRDIRLQTLNLLPDQKLTLAAALERDILPENRIYLYDHYRDNCTTRVRDRIDQAIGGRLAQATSGPARMSLRDHTRRYTSRSAVMDWLIMFVLAASVDRRATQWQEMFLPEELERDVRLVKIPDGNGGEMPLVASESMYANDNPVPPAPQIPPTGWPFALLFGCVVAVIAAALGLWVRTGRPAARVALGTYSAIVGFAFGLLGCVLFFLSNFTDHAITYWNENLLLANPLTLAALPLGILLASDWGRRASRYNLLAALWWGLSGIAGLYLIAKFPFGAHQDNLQAIVTMVPVLLGFSAAFWIGRPAALRLRGPARRLREKRRAQNHPSVVR